MSQKNAVLKALNKNQNGVSAETFTKSYRIGNVYEVVRQLREEGHPIYTNTVNGKTSFRLGSPNRAMVAAAYRLLGAQAFTR
jgi:hypothetical protein